MGLSDEAKIAKAAEDATKGHPEQVDEAVKEGEKFAQDRTDHRHDQQISDAGEQIERRLGADRESHPGQQGQDDQQGQQGQQQPTGDNGNNAGSGS